MESIAVSSYSPGQSEPAFMNTPAWMDYMWTGHAIFHWVLVLS
jgi:hypothetical protein